MSGRTIFIDGEWQASASGETIPVLNPSTAEAFAELDRGSVEEVDEAVRAALLELDFEAPDGLLRPGIPAPPNPR